MRRAHFKVEGIRFDGAVKAIVTVECNDEGGAAIFRVRGYQLQREAVSLLADVAQIVLERDAKALAAQRASITRRKR